MDPWDQIRRAVGDRRSGSVSIALRAAAGLENLSSRTDVLRAARALIRAHPAMALVWRALAVALEGGDVAAFAGRVRAGTRGAADGARWVVTRRNAVVLTHSTSSSVAAALERVRGRVAGVICTASLPGGEGRAFARRLLRDGFDVEVIPDAAIARACAEADVALVGADAVTEEAVVNKVGTTLVALAAREAGIGCYAIATDAKLIPSRCLRGRAMPLYDHAPLGLFDAVLTERGPRRAGPIRRAAARVAIPPALIRIGAATPAGR